VKAPIERAEISRIARHHQISTLNGRGDHPSVDRSRTPRGGKQFGGELAISGVSGSIEPISNRLACRARHHSSTTAAGIATGARDRRHARNSARFASLECDQYACVEGYVADRARNAFDARPRFMRPRAFEPAPQIAPVDVYACDRLGERMTGELSRSSR
jgi:hypothetical protein